MPRVFIGIGSNIGDRNAHLDLAQRELAGLTDTELRQMSQAYETDPVGPIPQGKFLNAAAEIETSLPPDELLDALTQIEQYAGRDTATDRQPWGPRALDLDILLYDQKVVSTDHLSIPHPLMHERWFVLKPLADIAPNAIHPILQMTIASLLSNVEQPTGCPPN